MTPKQKAKTLLFIINGSNINLEEFDKQFNSASNYAKKDLKRKALIVVDEILNNFGLKSDGKNFYTSSEAISFYEEVKKEIEKL